MKYIKKKIFKWFYLWKGKNVFNTLTMEDKRNWIFLYRNSIYPIPINNTYIILQQIVKKGKIILIILIPNN